MHVGGSLHRLCCFGNSNIGVGRSQSTYSVSDKNVLILSYQPCSGLFYHLIKPIRRHNDFRMFPLIESLVLASEFPPMHNILMPHDTQHLSCVLLCLMGDISLLVSAYIFYSANSIPARNFLNERIHA